MLKKRVLVPLGAVAVAAIAMLVVVMFARGDGAPAEEVVTDANDPVAEENVSQSTGAGGYAEGIGVQGDWVITVLNQDGSVAGTREFHNDLLADGQLALAELLSGERVLRLSVENEAIWRILLLLESGSFAGPCEPGTNFTPETPGDCFAGTINGFNFYGGGATASRDNSTVVLSMETVPFGGPATVERVMTVLGICGTGETDGTACVQGTGEESFTETAIAPVAIAEGQRILVTVTLSFATAP